MRGRENSGAVVERKDLYKVAQRLSDLGSYLANHGLEHEAAYVMMAFGRVRAMLAACSAGSGPEFSVGA